MLRGTKRTWLVVIQNGKTPRQLWESHERGMFEANEGDRYTEVLKALTAAEG